uniref:Uncharacterized protein n=1 Tax=Lygus hesperus TaxID=30085 RepID=A0A0K8TAQ5_LYGHE
MEAAANMSNEAEEMRISEEHQWAELLRSIQRYHRECQRRHNAELEDGLPVASPRQAPAPEEGRYVSASSNKLRGRMPELVVSFSNGRVPVGVGGLSRDWIPRPPPSQPLL